jgi:hypothetical protein
VEEGAGRRPASAATGDLAVSLALYTLLSARSFASMQPPSRAGIRSHMTRVRRRRPHHRHATLRLPVSYSTAPACTHAHDAARRPHRTASHGRRALRQNIRVRACSRGGDRRSSQCVRAYVPRRTARTTYAITAANPTVCDLVKPASYGGTTSSTLGRQRGQRTRPQTHSAELPRPFVCTEKIS